MKPQNKYTFIANINAVKSVPEGQNEEPAEFQLGKVYQNKHTKVLVHMIAHAKTTNYGQVLIAEKYDGKVIAVCKDPSNCDKTEWREVPLSTWFEAWLNANPNDEELQAALQTAKMAENEYKKKDLATIAKSIKLEPNDTNNTSTINTVEKVYMAAEKANKPPPIDIQATLKSNVKQKFHFYPMYYSDLGWMWAYRTNDDYYPIPEKPLKHMIQIVSYLHDVKNWEVIRTPKTHADLRHHSDGIADILKNNEGMIEKYITTLSPYLDFHLGPCDSETLCKTSIGILKIIFGNITRKTE